MIKNLLLMAIGFFVSVFIGLVAMKVLIPSASAEVGQCGFYEPCKSQCQESSFDSAAGLVQIVCIDDQETKLINGEFAARKVGGVWQFADRLVITKDEIERAPGYGDDLSIRACAASGWKGCIK